MSLCKPFRILDDPWGEGVPFGIPLLPVQKHTYYYRCRSTPTTTGAGAHLLLPVQEHGYKFAEGNRSLPFGEVGVDKLDEFKGAFRTAEHDYGNIGDAFDFAGQI